MRVGILGRKIGMTRFFSESGEAFPVTVIEAGPCPIVQIKTKARDGYDAIQIGFGQKKENSVNNPARGHFKKANVQPLKILREIRTDEVEKYKVGDNITLEEFSKIRLVDITGISKGKGFAGVVKRHHFHGGDATHGAETHRAPGSIGASSFPSRVVKGLRMAGRMGGERVTIQNLKVVKVDTERNILIVKGSIPGPKNCILMIRKAIKAS